MMPALAAVPLSLLAVAGALLAAYGVSRVRTSATAQNAAAGPSAAFANQASDSKLSARLAAAITAHAQPAAVRTSVAITDYSTGATGTFQPDQTFQTASVVKVDVLATLLLQAQDAARALTTTESTLAREMIVRSDNDATTELWQSVGGAAAITAAIGRLGLTATVPNPEAWGKTSTTAMDQLRILRALLDGDGPFNSASVTQARTLMGSVADDQSWGVSAAAGNGETVYLKNGWVTSDDDNSWIVHSIGEIRAPGGTVGIVVLSDGHTSLETGIDFVEAVAKLARACLGS
jgi:beta-lactamase class A